MPVNSNPSINRGRPPNIDAVGAISGTTTGLSVKEYGDGVIRQTVIRLDGVTVTMTDAGAAGSNGSVPLYVFPRGDITILGGTANFSSKATSTGSVDSQEPFTNTPGITANQAASGIATGAVVNWGVGSVAGAGALTTTEADIIASVATTLVSFTKTAVGRVIKLGTTIFPDATTTAGAAQTARLNFYVADADSGANDTLTVTGEIILTWLVSGDA